MLFPMYGRNPYEMVSKFMGVNRSAVKKHWMKFQERGDEYGVIGRPPRCVCPRRSGQDGTTMVQLF
jgi:hypothetical protein